MKAFIFNEKYVYFLIGILIFLGLYLTNLHTYLLLHSLVEIFSIVVACGIFVITWNSRRFLENNYLLFTGIAFLFVSGLDLIHTLAYRGMGVFKGYETNLPTQLWIAARYMQGVSLLIAPLLFRRKLKVNLVFLGYVLVTAILLLSIFYWDIFPDCFIEGVGLTPFKKISEYIISLILLGSIGLLLKNQKEFNKGVLQWIIGSIISAIISELAFTFYVDAYGLSNLIGHFFKLISFYLIYKAIIETGLRRPYDLLSRDLKQKEEALARLASFPELNPNPITEIDLIGNVYYLNPAAKKLFPDLQAAGPKHPWLADFESLVPKFKQELQASHVREIKVRNSWYEQAMHNVQQNRHIHIYGRDITGRKKAEQELRRIEWLLTKSSRQTSLSNRLKGSYEQPYGNLVQLNTSRILTDSVGEDVLVDIVSDFLDLLETSAAVYEKNGDYALGIFTSGWCRHLDQASRNLTGTDDNREALESGRWHCHESCWGEASKVCIETAQPVDIGCRGGIRIFAVPIWAEGKIVGSINFGYSDPPKDLQKLHEISERYDVNVDKLLEIAEGYDSRPFFIIELAKSRLFTSAKLIGTIFERKQAEEALQRSREELEIRVQERTAELTKATKKLMEQSRILEGFFTSTITPLVFLDRDFNYLRVNEAYAKACQRNVSEFPGHNHFELYPSDAKKIFEQVIQTKIPYRAVARPFIFPDHPEWGTTYWDWTLTPILDDTGEVEYLVFSLENVTERKQAEEALRAAHQYNRSLIEASLDPLVTISVDGKITDVNRATELVTGVPREQLIGSDFSDYFTEPEKAREGYQEVFSKGSVRDYPLAIRDISGHITDVLYHATLYRNKAGEVQGVFAAARDITERKYMEDALRESENRLRHLSSQLLTVQEDERKRISREIHDGIGQTLAAIKFGLENKLSSMGKGSGPTGISLESIISLAQSGIEESRRIQMDLRPSILDDLGISATIGWFTREFQKVYTHISIEKQILIEENEIPGSLKIILFRISQEAMNNIAKHSQANVIHLSLRRTGNKIELSIVDNGVGFDLENFKKGLGLTSMRERTELSGGSFTIESAIGKGTTIRASWPVS